MHACGQMRSAGSAGCRRIRASRRKYVNDLIICAFENDAHFGILCARDACCVYDDVFAYVVCLGPVCVRNLLGISKMEKAV